MNDSTRAVWAVLLDADPTSALASAREMANVEVAVDEAGQVWLRGPALSEADAERLRRLPCRVRFRLLDDRPDRDAGSKSGARLVAVRQRVPTRRLPALEWKDVDAALVLSSPAAAYPSTTDRRLSFEWRRSTSPREADVLLTDLDRLLTHVLTTLEARHRGLRFAASNEGGVVVWGAPLPPITGERFATVSRDGDSPKDSGSIGDVALPLGCELTPGLDLEVPGVDLERASRWPRGRLS